MAAKHPSKVKIISIRYSVLFALSTMLSAEVSKKNARKMLSTLLSQTFCISHGNIKHTLQVHQYSMIVTRNTVPPQEYAVQSSSDNDIDHSSLKTSVLPTVPVSSENDEVFHDTKDSLDDEEEEVNHKEVLFDQIKLYRSYFIQSKKVRFTYSSRARSNTLRAKGGLSFSEEDE